MIKSFESHSLSPSLRSVALLYKKKTTMNLNTQDKKNDGFFTVGTQSPHSAEPNSNSLYKELDNGMTIKKISVYHAKK